MENLAHNINAQNIVFIILILFIISSFSYHLFTGLGLYALPIHPAYKIEAPWEQEYFLAHWYIPSLSPYG